MFDKILDILLKFANIVEAILRYAYQVMLYLAYFHLS